MSFLSILNPSWEENAEAEMSDPPSYFADLSLDQIVASITADKTEYNLAPFFHQPLKSHDAIAYRQAVMLDLENDARYDAVARFAASMSSMRQRLGQAGKLHYKYQKEAWLLDAAELYSLSVERLLSDLRAAPPSSPGLARFFAFLAEYAGSPAFQGLLSEIATLKAELSSIRYTLLIGDGVVTVSDYHDEADYGAELQADFEKFKQGAAGDHIFKFRDFAAMNHIEAGVLDRVARLNPEILAKLDGFSARSGGFFDRTILRFDREVQFYAAYIAHMRRFAGAGLKFCYPRVSAESKDIRVRDGYDLALAKTPSVTEAHPPRFACKDLYEVCLALTAGKRPVGNDISADGKSLILVTGANQGGKTTFLRSFGLAQLMSQSGMFAPAASLRLNVVGGVFTHFKREEDTTMRSGKFDEELSRMNDIVNAVRPRALLLFNESFAATNEREGSEIARQIVSALLEKPNKIVFVSHLYDFAHGFYERSLELDHVPAGGPAQGRTPDAQNGRGRAAPDELWAGSLRAALSGRKAFACPESAGIYCRGPLRRVHVVSQPSFVPCRPRGDRGVRSRPGGPLLRRRAPGPRQQTARRDRGARGRAPWRLCARRRDRLDARASRR